MLDSKREENVPLIMGAVNERCLFFLALIVRYWCRLKDYVKGYEHQNSLSGTQLFRIWNFRAKRNHLSRG